MPSYFANPYAPNQSVRYGFERERRNVWRVARSAPVAYGVRGYGSDVRTFERVGTASFTKRGGWHSEIAGTHMQEALALARAKYPSSPRAHVSSFSVVV
jgi:hypothetical protein